MIDGEPLAIAVILVVVHRPQDLFDEPPIAELGRGHAREQRGELVAVALDALRHLVGDVGGAHDGEAGGGDQLAFERRQGRGCQRIGEAEETTRLQHPRDLGQESRRVGVAVAGLDVEHDVEDPAGEGQPLGVGLQETQPGEPVGAGAEMHRFRTEVQRYDARRLVVAGQVRARAAAATAGVQDGAAAQLEPGEHVANELDGVPPRQVLAAQAPALLALLVLRVLLMGVAVAVVHELEPLVGKQVRQRAIVAGCRVGRVQLGPEEQAADLGQGPIGA